MLSDGSEIVLAHWREVGAWWAGETPIEGVQTRDARGTRREVLTPLEPVCRLEASAEPYSEDNSEEVALRPRKTRDEKVALACGYAPHSLSLVHPANRGGRPTYCPLHVLSGYAFGQSVLFAEEIPRHALRYGMPAIGIADPFSLVGAVEFAHEAKKLGVKPLVGAGIEMPEGGEIVLIARDKRGYESLSQLIAACHLEEPRQFPLGSWARLERHSRGLVCLTGGDRGPIDRMLASRRFEEAGRFVERLAGLYGRDNVFVEIERSWLPWTISVNQRLSELAERHGLTPVAGGSVTHSRPSQFPAQDILVCAETLCTVDEIVGRKPQRHASQPQIKPVPRRAINAERYLRTPEELAELFADRPDWIENTLRVADRCDDDVLPARTQLPCLFGDPAQALRQAVEAGASLRYRTIGPRLRRRLESEVERIIRLNFAGHFLTMWDACRWATEQGILFSGRGSVVDSVVAYSLGLSRIDAFEHNLHFDRFLPADGSKRPDIDIDFEAHRRDDVRNYLSRTYGKDRVATVAAIGAFCTRGIVREVGKALGLAPEVVGFLAKRVHGGVSPKHLEDALQKRPELRDSGIPKERFRWVFRLAEMLADVPRNMRAHSSGVVISDRPLAETVPVMWSASGGANDEEPGFPLASLFEDENPDRRGRQEDSEADPCLRIIQWDKRSAKHFFDKFDILCLRGQDVLSGTQRRVRSGSDRFSVEQIPLDDEDTYRAMRSGELIGIPQSASPAMRQAHMRLRTENLHDASLVQAGIRPGVGGAVKMNQLIARRRGLQPCVYEHPDLERILGITFGIVVFQEQVDQLLQTFCAYGSGEAEDIRDKIHKRRREDYGQLIKEEVLGRIRSRGYSESVAQHVFELIAGFKGYGFAQGHALAFAEISIRSIFCQQNYPAEYFAALLDAQPAGYYGPCTLANEARARGVAVLPVDVDLSGESFSVEDVRSAQDPQIVFPNGGLRVSLRQVRGLSAATREAILAERSGLGPFVSFFDFCRRVRPSRDELESLVMCGAFDRMHPNRRALLWAVAPAVALNGARPNPGAVPLPFESVDPRIDNSIEDFSVPEKAIHERMVLGMDVHRHLMAFERERVASKGCVTSAEAKRLRHGDKAIVVGNPIRLRFPPTPSGKRVVFFDLEDETGLLNVTCFDATYRRDGHAIVCSPYVTIVGTAQDRDGHTAFLARRVYPYHPTLASTFEQVAATPVATADFLVG